MVSSAPSIITHVSLEDAVRGVFLPFQIDWLRDRSDMRLGEKSRQIGWTWANAGEDAMNGTGLEAGHRDAKDVHFMAGDSNAAKEYVDDVANWLEVFKSTAHRFTDDWFDPKTELTHTVQVVEFPNGTKLNGMSSNPRRLRGRRGRVKLDEFAFHDNQRELLRAATPVITWGGNVSAWSTHNGTDSVFYTMCEMGARRAAGNPRKGDMAWSLHRVDLHDAIAQGLVERINEVTKRSMTREEYIESCRARCLTEDDFNQEYLCQPAAEQSAWLPYDLIDSCTSDRFGVNVAPVRSDLGEFLNDVRQLSEGASTGGGAGVYAGVDFARSHDRFVIWVVAKFGDVYRTAGILSWRGKRWAEMKHAIESLMNLRRPSEHAPIVRRACLDKTGMGSEPAEWAEENFRLRAEGVTFTTDSKVNMAVAVRNVFDDRHIVIPWDEWLRSDLHSITKETSKSGKPRFVGERTKDGHADGFWSLGLTMEAASTKVAQARAVTIVGGDF